MKTHTQHTKALDEYYRALTDLRGKYVTNEEGLRPAFQGLLSTFGREHGWTLVPELRLANGSKPDGTLVDNNTLHRGYWEAKDTKDDLESEIQKKIAKGYPLTNIIFEDTQHAILYQQGKRVFEVPDLTQPKWVSDLLNQFFSYTEPAIEQFEQAVDEFHDRIPDLARGLLALITQERGTNKKFQQAFAAFHDLCREALNPQISVAAIEEMLVQHLLTERLFRTIFNNPDFIHHNVIAAEIEKVIRALTSRVFDRTEFLKGLDRFYLAIEEAARTRIDWVEKQAFLNTVYERFFQGFSVKQADTHGIVYTPQEIVDFMVASVEDVLQREFGASLSTPGVQILDPCTGTGNFIVNILQRIAGSALRQKYTQDLFANEIMLLPYYIASLNIEHAYYERIGQYLPFEGICFADTLDMVTEGQPAQLPGFSEANTERIERESQAEITVVIGNPPYNAWQQSENDNNKNRQYKRIEGRVRDTYATDSKATNKNALGDPYIKFFRWATDRLGKRDGIVCFVSNNSFVDQIAFDGMRKHLLQDFTEVYHLDLHGNVRKNPKLSGTTHNVFGIQVGVGVTVAVRHSQQAEHVLHYFRVPEHWRKEEKYTFLTEKKSIAGVEWQTLQPDSNYTWLTEGMRSEFADFLPMGTKEGKNERAQNAEVIFKSYGGGVKTNRDEWVYDYHREALAEKIKRFIKTYNSEVDSWKRRTDRTVKVDDFVTYDNTKIKWGETLKQHLVRGQDAQFDEWKIRAALYRPFCKQWLFFDRLLNERVYQFPQFLPTSASEMENRVIWLKVGSDWPMFALMTNIIPDLLPQGGSQCFPFYTYAEDGSDRQENITDWALKQFQVQYGPEVSKWGIFNYVYALLHHPTYRERYAENLKRELPRIPLVPDRESFTALVQIGAGLAKLHLGYEQAQEYPLQAKEHRAVPYTWRVTKMRLSPDKTAVVVNDALTLTGLPPECFFYRLGNRSALEWVIDQYQVSTDPRSGIITDPNREDDSEYIARLVKQVVTVSVETVRLVARLPALPETNEAEVF